MLHVCDLESVVLKSTAAKTCNEFFIISGYVGPEMIEELTHLNKEKIVVVYGMYGNEKITHLLHEKLIELDTNNENLEIYYSTVPVHSKLYCWSNNGNIEEILIGSANFSVNGLRKDYRESLHSIPSTSYNYYINYQKYIIDNWVRCTDKNVDSKSKPQKVRNTKVSQPLINKGICRMSLLDNKGKVPLKSGINWGYQKGHHTVSQLEAYIGIKAEYRHLFPTMFPEKKYINGATSPSAIGKKAKQNDDIEIVWDDHKTMVGLMEGSKPTKGGTVYPLQISSSADKTILGLYLRKRIVQKLIEKNKSYALQLQGKLDRGESFKVTKRMLLDYGRNHIDVYMDNGGIYYFDFSV